MDGLWINRSRISLEYDSSGNETVSLFEEWQNYSWQNNILRISFYSNQNRKDSLLFQMWDNNEWQNFAKTSFHYYELTNFLDYFEVVIWIGSNWQNFLMRRVVNDSNGNQIEQLEVIWNNNLWENSVRRFYTYIDLNYTESAYCELWNGTNWVSGDETILIENPDGYKIGFMATHSVTIYYKTTSVNENTNFTPIEFKLEQNYPNPFNPSTSIQYTISSKQFVSLKVYDVLGNEVATLVNEEKPAGTYEVEFSVGINSILSLTSGVYLYTLRAGSFVETKKMLILK